MEKTESEHSSASVLLLPVLGLAASAVVYFAMRSKRATVWGLVTDRDTAQPIEGVTVTLDSRITYTDRTGYYEFRNIKLGSYAIVFEKEGYTPVYGAVTPAPGLNQVNVEMEPLTGTS